MNIVKDRKMNTVFRRRVFRSKRTLIRYSLVIRKVESFRRLYSQAICGCQLTKREHRIASRCATLKLLARTGLYKYDTYEGRYGFHVKDRKITLNCNRIDDGTSGSLWYQMPPGFWDSDDMKSARKWLAQE